MIKKLAEYGMFILVFDGRIGYGLLKDGVFRLHLRLFLTYSYCGLHRGRSFCQLLSSGCTHLWYSLLRSARVQSSAGRPLAVQSEQSDSAHSPGIGFALGLLLAILISSAVLKRTADVNWLEKHGRRVMAEIKGINQHRGSRTDANGNSTYYTYYIITSEWVDPATRIIHTFNSDQIYSPGRYQVGDAIQVWIDPKNAGKYVVNVA